MSLAPVLRPKSRRKRDVTWSIIVTVRGISGIEAKIYKSKRSKKSREGRVRHYISYMLSYRGLGGRKVEAFSDLEEAQGTAESAIKKIANGEQQVLELRNEDRHVYVRSTDLLKEVNVPLDRLKKVEFDLPFGS